MAKRVFIHNQTSNYDDKPESHYHFPKVYLSRVKEAIGDWILYYESGSNGGAMSYKGLAKLSHITQDPLNDKLFYGWIAPQTYLPFEVDVPLTDTKQRPHNSYLVDERGLTSRGKRVSAVRPISDADFAKIVNLGLPEETSELPRFDSMEIHEEPSQFIHDMPRDQTEIRLTKWVRERSFRTNVIKAYDKRCAFTGMRFINGGGRAEVQAAHIRPVYQGGPDSITNGLALSGTTHWMFDRGLLSLADGGEILVSRHINNLNEIDRLLPKNRQAFLPEKLSQRPHPDYLEWHRENCYKT